jgi:general stress protein 26
MSNLFNDTAKAFLAEHTIATLSTADQSGKAHGAVVYYLTDNDQEIYFVSKNSTTKVNNIQQNPQVAFTIFDAPSIQTLQISGRAAQETDQQRIDYFFENLVKPHPYSGSMLMPPVTAIKEGEYVVMRISPTEVHFSDYKAMLQSGQTT